MKTWAIVAIALAVVGAVLVILWQATDWFTGASSSSSSGAAADESTAGSSRVSVVVAPSLEAGSSSRLRDSEEFERHCELVDSQEHGGRGTSTTYACSLVREEDGTVRPPHVNSDELMFGGVRGEQLYFHAWDENSLRLPLVNMTGAFDSMVLTAGADMWSEGFEMDLDRLDESDGGGATEAATIRETVAAMVENVRANSALLLGDSVLGDPQAEARYTFDVANGSSYPAQLIKGVSRVRELADGDAARRGGMLRLSLRSLDFEFRVNGASKHLQIVTAGVGDGQIGDKRMLVGGEWKYYDMDTGAFVVTRPSRPSSMWTSGRGSDGEEDAEQAAANQAMEQVFVELTRKSLVPMPVELTTAPDLGQLTAGEDANVTVNVRFMTVAHVGLRGLEGTDEAAISDADVIENFDIESLGLTATVTLTPSTRSAA